MKLSEFCWMPYSDDRDDYRDYVKAAAIDENWGQDDRYLAQYLGDNFEIAHMQGKVQEKGEGLYCLWRAGTLTTREGNPITMLGVKNKLTGKQPYVFKYLFDRQRFTVKVDGEEFKETAPEPPAYEAPQYEKDFKLVYNFAHYLDDHEERVAESFPNLTPHQRFLCIYAALELAHKRGAQAAVPQWYRDRNASAGNYQWLLPLHVKSENISEKPDLVAVLQPLVEYQEYNIPTLVPPDWAYGHARAISDFDPQFRSWG